MITRRVLLLLYFLLLPRRQSLYYGFTVVANVGRCSSIQKKNLIGFNNNHHRFKITETYSTKNDDDDDENSSNLGPLASIQNSWKYRWKEFQIAKDDGFGTKAKNAAINATVGDIIVPLCSDLELRQTLANRGIYAGVEYKICSLSITTNETKEEDNGSSNSKSSSIQSLEGLDYESKRLVEALVRPAYPLRDNLERNDWPVSINLLSLESKVLWLSRATYEAGTAVGTLFFSGTSLLLAAIVAFFIQFVSVPTASMIPALNPGNIVVVTRSIRPFSSPPKVSDIVFFDAPNELEATIKANLKVDSVSSNSEKSQDSDQKQEDEIMVSTKGKQFLKRVVAVPGEKVGVKRSSPFVPLGEDDSQKRYRFDVVGPYIRPEIFPESSWDRPPTVLEKNEYFVAGDNGYRSVDSRVWGPLQGKYIVGTAQWIVWPIKDFGPIPSSTEISEITITK